MNTHPTKVIFLWHMHQPYYKAIDKDYYILPWVRLHAVKDYYGMAKIVDKFNVKVTFNFSGVLLKQLLDYTDKAKDYYSILTLKNPKYLAKEEKDFIIDRFFSVNFERFIRPNKRYLQLYNKKLSKKPKFTKEDINDLTSLFNLCWFHPYTFIEDKNLLDLFLKKKNYTQEDKEYIINKQYKIIASIFPLYKKLLKDKKIEISISPYYHPIMPLVFDTDILNEFHSTNKPSLRFSYPEDCIWHLEKSKEIFKDIFGYEPVGSWPSEGSVSEDIIYIYKDRGFNWIATDEGILFRSLTTEYVSYDMIKNQRHILSQVYDFGGLNIFFRDRNLSDMISFIYQGWDDFRLASDDLIMHLERSHSYLKDIFKERAIVIIMDGENAWEYYKNNGVDFLERIYDKLEKSNTLSTTTPQEFLKNTKAKRLQRVLPGSWINSNFDIWIGNKKNNLYWCILRKIKDLCKKLADREKIDTIKKYIYILEGSDWFWWNTFEDITGEFRKIFYSYIVKIYKILDKKPPRLDV